MGILSGFFRGSGSNKKKQRAVDMAARAEKRNIFGKRKDSEARRMWREAVRQDVLRMDEQFRNDTRRYLRDREIRMERQERALRRELGLDSIKDRIRQEANRGNDDMVKRLERDKESRLNVFNRRVYDMKRQEDRAAKQREMDFKYRRKESYEEASEQYHDQVAEAREQTAKRERMQDLQSQGGSVRPAGNKRSDLGKPSGKTTLAA